MHTNRIYLYWNSIPFSSTLSAFYCSLRYLFHPDHFIYSKLTFLLNSIFPSSHWFFFNSARSGLSFYLQSLLYPGDEVIVQAYTCIAVPYAIIAAGMKPIFVDIDPHTLSIDEKLLSSLVNSRTKAIIVQHTLGNAGPISACISFAKQHNLIVIEDCALSIGSSVHNKLLGTFGDASIFSLELSKTLSCGWGGLLRINNTEHVSKLDPLYRLIPKQNIFYSFKDFLQTFINVFYHSRSSPSFFSRCSLYFFTHLLRFRTSTPDYQVHLKPSASFVRRMGYFQLILSIVQWKRFPDIRSKCMHNFILISRALHQSGFIVHSPSLSEAIPVSNRVSFICSDPSFLIAAFIQYGIDIGKWFNHPVAPLPQTSEFVFDSSKYPISNFVSRHVTNIPCHASLSNSDLSLILSVIKKFSYLSLSS